MQNNNTTYTKVKSEALCTEKTHDSLDNNLQSGYSLVKLNHKVATAIGLPFKACEKEHYITAHLFVSVDAEATGSHEGKTIGQTIVLSNCDNGTTSIYQRTGTCKASEICKWGEWRSLATMEELENRILKEVDWEGNSRIDSFLEAGTYNITGQRLNIHDGLPIANAAPGHTINAHLVVLDSSIAGTGVADDKCITQILLLGNRIGGDGDVYIRTGRAVSKNLLAGGSGWEPWGKLQQNVEVGQVTSLNSYIGNGMYSGVYTDGNSFFETFVMVVINNYAVAGETGKVRSVSQFKYALGIDGTFSYRSRSGQGNTGISWGEWVDLNGATTSMIQDGAVTVQKLSTEVRDKVDNPLRPLFIAAGADYNDSGVDKTKTAPWGESVTHKAGHYYLNGLGDITEEQMMEIYINKDFVYMLDIGRLAQGNITLRTFMAVKATLISDLIGKRSFNGLYSFAQTKIEVFCATRAVSLNTEVPEQTIPCSSLYGTFFNSESLRIVYPINVKNINEIPYTTFCGCYALKELRLYGLKASLNLFESILISKNSIVYMIQNAAPTSAITITLHQDAYARLADDADIVAALEAQPLISLVSA